MLLLMWSGGCTLSALSAATLARDGGPWLLGIAAVLVAPATLVGGRLVRAPARAAWPIAIGCAALGALGPEGGTLALYLASIAATLVVADAIAVRFVARADAPVPDEHPSIRRTLRTTTLADPVARELARARREELPLAVASISVPDARAASRRLTRIGRELSPSLRRTDAVVLAVGRRLVVLLPGGDDDIAMSVLERAIARRADGVCVGTATFPRDGTTWAALTSVAQARERPWSAVARSPQT